MTFIPAIIIFALMVLVVFKALVMVSPTERAAIFRLGRYQRLLSPGLHIHIPFIDLVNKVDLVKSIPGWQTFTPRELESAVVSFVLLGRVDRTFKVNGDRPPAARQVSGPDRGVSSREQELLVQFLLGKAKEQIGVDLSRDELAKLRLTEQADKIIKNSAGSGPIQVDVPFITADASGPRHLNCAIERSEFESVMKRG